MSRPRLLDLCCGAGGAAMGYHLAGFDVTGVDIRPQPHYPFSFIQADALTVPLEGFDVIHASPPCQAHSCTRSLHGKTYPDILPQLRARLAALAVPWVIENVPGAPLHNPLLLCGSMFDLAVIRHRLFESNVLLLAPGVQRCRCRGRVTRGEALTIAGHLFPAEAGRLAMGIAWMNRDELSQAIPPPYTEWIGRQLLEVAHDGHLSERCRK